MSELRLIKRSWFHKGMNKEVPKGCYETHIIRKECCGKDPDLYGGHRQAGFFTEGVWQFRCDCGRRGDTYITPNGAAASWNKQPSEVKRRMK